MNRARQVRYNRTTIGQVLAEQGRTQTWFTRRLRELTGQQRISPTYVSKILSGKKPIPEWFPRPSCQLLGLPESVLFSCDSEVHVSTLEVAD